MSHHYSKQTGYIDRPQAFTKRDQTDPFE